MRRVEQAHGQWNRPIITKVRQGLERLSSQSGIGFVKLSNQGQEEIGSARLAEDLDDFQAQFSIS